MYILIDYSGYYCGRKTFAYESFEELKKDVIEKLNGKGWSDKSKVDLRSSFSCLMYMLEDYFNVSYKKTKSYKKFFDYRYGTKTRAL